MTEVSTWCSPGVPQGWESVTEVAYTCDHIPMHCYIPSLLPITVENMLQYACFASLIQHTDRGGYPCGIHNH